MYCSIDSKLLRRSSIVNSASCVFVPSLAVCDERQRPRRQVDLRRHRRNVDAVVVGDVGQFRARPRRGHDRGVGVGQVRVGDGGCIRRDRNCCGLRLRRPRVRPSAPTTVIAAVDAPSVIRNWRRSICCTAHLLRRLTDCGHDRSDEAVIGPIVGIAPEQEQAHQPDDAGRLVGGVERRVGDAQQRQRHADDQAEEHAGQPFLPLRRRGA